MSPGPGPIWAHSRGFNRALLGPFIWALGGPGASWVQIGSLGLWAHREQFYFLRLRAFLFPIESFGFVFRLVAFGLVAFDSVWEHLTFFRLGALHIFQMGAFNICQIGSI